jgi:hypothetical protein
LCATAAIAGECSIAPVSPAAPTFPIRLFGGVLTVPLDYTLNGTEALSRPGGRLLEFHSQRRVASLSIGNMADTEGWFTQLPVLCTAGTLTVRQKGAPGAFRTVIQDNEHYVSIVSKNPDEWQELLRDLAKAK